MKSRALSTRDYLGTRKALRGQPQPGLLLPEAEIREAIQRIREAWPGQQTAGPGWRVYPVPSEPGRLVRVELYLDDLERPGA